MHCLIVSACFLIPVTHGQPAGQDKFDANAIAARTLVTEFFKNWKDGVATRSGPVLLGLESTVVGIGQFREHKVWRKPLQEWLAELEKNPPQHLRLDDLQVDVSAGTLAIVKSTHTGYGTKGRSVFTLFWVNNQWKLATVVLETRFNW